MCIRDRVKIKRKSFEMSCISVFYKMWKMQTTTEDVYKRQLSCDLLEHWHTALLVAASYYLSEELHGTMLAFRTLAAGILVAEKSVRCV